MYILSQELEVWYIIPAVRKEISKVLTKDYDMNMEDVGNILGVSKAAISQYLSGKRATKIKLPEKIKQEIKKSARVIFKNKNLAVKEMQRVLRLIRDSKCSCTLCKKYNKGILGICKMKPDSVNE